jgi:phage baseplate assembly protein gpV
MIPNNFIEYYGDQTRWFLGEVVKVKDDPLKLGRVKVKVFGVYDDIDDAHLPWAQIVVPVTQGVHEGKGQYLGILVGTQVFGIFLDGQNSQLPMVIGTVPKEGDANPKADANYPTNKVYETESGHYKEYDDTDGAERIKESHTSGTFYEMMADGSITTYITKDNYSIVLGDESVTIVGKVTINVGGDVDLTAGGTVSINAKNLKLNS